MEQPSNPICIERLDLFRFPSASGGVELLRRELVEPVDCEYPRVVHFPSELILLWDPTDIVLRGVDEATDAASSFVFVFVFAFESASRLGA